MTGQRMSVVSIGSTMEVDLVFQRLDFTVPFRWRNRMLACPDGSELTALIEIWERQCDDRWPAYCAPIARSGGKQSTDTPSREAPQLKLPTAGQLLVCTTDTVPHELNFQVSFNEKNEDKIPELVDIDKEKCST